MIFKPYYRYETGCAAYLFGCGSLGQCVVVDAHEADVGAYADFAAVKGMRITYVIDTHVHADHPSGGPALASRVGATYALHEAADVELPFEPLRDGQRIEFVADREAWKRLVLLAAEWDLSYRRTVSRLIAGWLARARQRA